MNLASTSKRIWRLLWGACITWFALLFIAIFIAGLIGRKNAQNEKLRKKEIFKILDDTWKDLNKSGMFHAEYQAASVIAVLEQNIRTRE